MPDIAMCKNDKCIKKNNCYRYKAKPSTYQSYFAEDTLDKEGNCKYYIPISKQEI